MTTIIFTIGYSFASLNTFHYKYAASLLAGFPLMVMAMRKFKQSSFKTSLFYMMTMLIVVLGIRTLINFAENKIVPPYPVVA